MSLRPSIPMHQRRGHVLETAPASEPVTAAELRTHLNMSSTSELSDTDANSLVADARALLEEFSGLALINQTWRLSLDTWPAGNEPWWDGVRQGSITDLYSRSVNRSLELPRYPLSSITSCTVYNEAGDATAVTVANTFDVDTYSKPGRLTLRKGATWPVALRANNAIQILYVAGFGSSATNVPGPLKRAIKQLAAYHFEHRGDACSTEEAMSKSGAVLMLNAYRVSRL